MLEEAKRALEEGKSGAHSQLQRAEEELEMAMDAILDAEMGDDKEDGHLAMNYWFHPPDGNDFDALYSTDFWPNDYRDRFPNKSKTVAK